MGRVGAEKTYSIQFLHEEEEMNLIEQNNILKQKPIAFKRISDGEWFTLCDDGETYSNLILKMEFPHHVIIQHSKNAFPKEEFAPVYWRDLVDI